MSKDPLSYYHAYSSMFQRQNKMPLQNKHDKDDRWIYECNPDTGEIRYRKAGDYGNEHIVTQEGINYEEAALNLNGQEWNDFIDSLSNEQKIQLSRCWD